MSRFTHGLLVLLCSSLAACGEPAWAKSFGVECTVGSSRVIVESRDLPEGLRVEVSALPELGREVNASGLYLADASLAPLSLGTHTLTFVGTLDGRSVERTCEIERPPLGVEVEFVSRDAAPFARASVQVLLAQEGEDETPQTKTVGLSEDGRYQVALGSRLLENVEWSGGSITLDERGEFLLPLGTQLGAKETFVARGHDGDTKTYAIELVGATPYTDEDRVSLMPVDAAHPWAAPTPENEGPIAAILVGSSGGPLRWTVGLAALRQVERIARVDIEETVVDTCAYRSSDGVSAEIDRVRLDATIALHDARTGALVRKATMQARPPRCPETSEFLVFDETDAQTGKQVVGDVMPDVEAWFDRESQR